MKNSELSKLTIGIIGFGNFGKTLQQMFASMKYSPQIKMYSRRYKREDSTEFFKDDERTIFAPLKEVVESDFLFHCVPISKFEGWLELHQDKLSKMNNEQALVEVCSVNTLPAEWMRDYAPDSVNLISSHPLFGPASTKNGTTFAGLRFVIHPLRIDKIFSPKLELLIEALKELEIEVIDMGPSEHDRQIAHSQAFTFFVGNLGIEMGLESTQIDTLWFRRYLDIQEMVAGDTQQLFRDMFRYNPEAVKMLKQMKLQFNKLNSKLEEII